jgi:hypothetical protein
MFPDCKELEKLRRKDGYTPRTILFLTAYAKSIGKSDANDLAQICKS